MCLNWKVIAVLAAVAVGLFVYAPGFAFVALPFLVLLICPLSMIVMMLAMNGMDDGSRRSGAECAASEQQVQGKEGQLARLEAQQQELAAKIAALEAE
jgi:membrane protein implicated in regulation of membrane protease activity